MEYINSLRSLLGWRNLAGAAITYYATLAFYRLFLHPLARFPGPKLAAISRWYEAYYDVVQNGQYTKKIAELHKQYGPIIRISPFELHVIDPAFYDKIYRMDGRWDKYRFMYDAFGAKNSTIFGSDHDAHKAHRAAIAPLFSKAKVASRQDLIRKNVDKLCKRIDGLAANGTTLNIGAAVSAFTRDIANEYITGKEYNELDREDWGIGLSISSQGAGVFWRTTKHIRWFGPTLRSIPIDWVMKTADEGTQQFLRYLQQSEADTKATLAAATSADANDDKSHATVVHEIVRSKLPPSEKTFERVFEEIATLTGAAFETTASVLRLILFHVYSEPEIIRRVRDEIIAAAATSPDPIPLTTLENLPYLTSVLMEGMRLSPAIGSRSARLTDKDLVYGNWRIPAGTPVGMTTLLMHTDEKLYPEPLRFNPDRWMDPADRKALDKVYAPFSKGTRICVGMQ
ncbi:cytochrome P450 [Chaetomium sp. MPI-CAGE-AT-0009]|nr:cytochrome P450 [Chaetomium sp. MPI-CAGE-AT-0009]